MKWLLPMLLLLAACGGGANADPRATEKYIEQQASSAYAALPDAAEIPALRDKGRDIFKAAGCELCHSTLRQRQGMTGPPLGGISEQMLDRHKKDALEGRRWLFKHIRDPQRFPGPHAGADDYRGAFMPPNNRLNNDEMRALIEFLWHLP